MGNNIALVIYSLCMSLLLRSAASLLGWESFVKEGSVLVETVVSTLIIIFFAEFLPKSIFKENPNFYYRALAPVIFGFYLLLYPLARFTTLLSQGILRLLGHKAPPRTEQEQFDRTDLMNLLDANNSEPQHEADNEMKLFQNALDFADLRVRDCMVPRVDVEAIDADATSIEQLTARFVETKYTRIFVWRKSIDNMIGYVNSKSLFNNPRSIDEVLMEVLCVPETQLSEKEWVLSCRLEVKYLNEKYDLGIEESREYDTLAGFIIYQLEGIPAAGETVSIGDLQIKILRTTRSRIELARIKRV